MHIRTHLDNTLYLSSRRSDLSCAAELVIAVSKLVLCNSICSIVLCADSLSPCEPWEAVWAGLKVSCLPVDSNGVTNCQAKIGCPVVRVTGATTGFCDGVYRHDSTVLGPFPVYHHVEIARTLSFNGATSKWEINDMNGDNYHSATGETFIIFII